MIHRLTPLTPVESRAMLAAVLGWSRVSAEPGPADALAELCGHFPLSLRIAATRLLLRPRQSIADGVRWLRADPIGRLSLAGTPQMSLAPLLQTFLDAVEPHLVDAFAAVAGIVGAPLVSLAECAVALRLDPDPAAVLLDRLVDANLVDSDEEGVYQIPALLLAFARSRLARSCSG
jgi:hypothetical protein